MPKQIAELAREAKSRDVKGKDAETRWLEFAAKHEKKQKIRRLSRLVDGFLEKKIDQDELKAETEEIERLRSLLEENLWERSILPFDPNELYEPEEPIGEATERLLYVHSLVTSGFWQRFKEELFEFQEKILPERERMRTGEDARKLVQGIDMPFDAEGLGDQYSEEVYRERYGSFDLKMPEKITIHYSLEGKDDTVYFYPSGINAIHNLINLINGLPRDIFMKCADEGCGRCFIRTSEHRRSFCSRRCAARKKQREKRQRDPEGYRKYHRNYYKRKKLAETEKILRSHRKGGGRRQ